MQSRQAERRVEFPETRMNRERTAMLEELMEQAVSPENWEAALYAVERNRGAAGPDGMKADELRRHLVTHGSVIVKRLLEGSYRPGAARRRDICPHQWRRSGGLSPFGRLDTVNHDILMHRIGVVVRARPPQTVCLKASRAGLRGTCGWKSARARAARDARGSGRLIQALTAPSPLRAACRQSMSLRSVPRVYTYRDAAHHHSPRQPRPVQG